MDFQLFISGVTQDVDRFMSIRRSSSINLQLPSWNLPKLKRLREMRVRGMDRLGSASGERKRHLPVGSGDYTVGCVDIMSDYGISGTFIRLYYPTKKTDVFTRQAQWPLWLPRKQYGHGYMYFRRHSTKVFGTLFNWAGGDVYVPVLWQAPLLSDGTRFPLVLFTHGLGGNRTTYTTLCSDLASHGFIVAAIEHRDGSASMTYCFKPSECKEPHPMRTSRSSPGNLASDGLGSDGDDVEDDEDIDVGITMDDVLDCDGVAGLTMQEHWLWYDRQLKEDDFEVRNRQVHVRVGEIERMFDLLEAINVGKDVHNVLGHQFDLRQLKGLMDMSRVAVIGHSFGGATAVAALAADKRLKCGVALDAWMLPLDDTVYDNVTQPVLLINTETFQWKSNVRDMYRLGVNEDSDQARRRLLITIRGTCHQSHTDFQFICPRRLAKLLAVRHDMSPRMAMSLNNQATRGFLYRHLDISEKEYPDGLLSGTHPSVILGTNLDLSSDV